jgi:flavodoxin-like protein
MTRAVVVVESMFGNTEAVAQAVAEGLSDQFMVDVVRVADAPTVIANDVDLLVVGGPTHAFGLTREGTRLAARDQGAKPSTGVDVGLREWLGRLHPHSTALAAAAFDTRIKKTGVPGSAARAAMRRLRRLGFRAAARPTSFYVAGIGGPLLAGELTRARGWGAHLAANAAAGQLPTQP